MDPPVDENPAAGLCLGGEGSAKAGNTSETPEGAVYVINVAEFTCIRRHCGASASELV